LGNYTISAYAWPLPGEIDTVDNLYVDGTIYIRQPIHDIAITQITLPRRTLCHENIYIYVTIRNKGDYSETFQVSVNYTRILDPLIGTQDITLTPGESIILEFTWTPTNIGIYEIKAYTSTIPEDINLSDNTKIAYISVGSGDPWLSYP